MISNDDFNLDTDIVYLNHAAIAPWPGAARDAVTEFATENSQRGAQHYPHWMTRQQRLRQRVAELIGAADGDDIALIANTSEGLSMVAFGLDWTPGQNVVTFAGEFPSNRMPWEQLPGVELRKAPLNIDADPEADLLALCDADTRLITVSAVQFHNGFRTDLERIGEYARQHNILFCIDAIQSLGALQFDVNAVHADFVTADGHKWMLGPEGLGIFWVRPELREQLKLHRFGWHMRAEPGEYSLETWQISPTATRFEAGSPNLLPAYALDASLGLLLDSGMPAIEQQILNNSRHIIDRVQNTAGLRLTGSSAPQRLSGAVSFAVENHDANLLWKQLLERGVVVAPRGGGLRLSPHAYQGAAEIDRTFAALAELM